MRYRPFAMLLLLSAGATSSLGQVERDTRPDLIVSDLRHEGDMLVLEVQNQGPGIGSGTLTASVSGQFMMNPRLKNRVEVEIETPRSYGAVVTKRIPLEEFAIPLGGEFDMMFDVKIDTANAVSESREGNNSFWRQIFYSRSSRKIWPPRAPYAQVGLLPDLVVTDIVHDGPYLKVKYRNASTGATGADFIFKIEANGKAYDGNYYYRFYVPPGNTEQETGGLTLGLVGITRGSEVDVKVTVDWEDRVRESDETNNVFSKRVRIAP